MARYVQSYVGEHRTRSIGVKLTPAERAALEEAAAAQGAQLSAYIRMLCLKRSAVAAPPPKVNPLAKDLLFELRAIGNNLNQIARRTNIHGEVPREAELVETLDLLKAAMNRVLDL